MFTRVGKFYTCYFNPSWSGLVFAGSLVTMRTFDKTLAGFATVGVGWMKYVGKTNSWTTTTINTTSTTKPSTTITTTTTTLVVVVVAVVVLTIYYELPSIRN